MVHRKELWLVRLTFCPARVIWLDDSISCLLETCSDWTIRWSILSRLLLTSCFANSYSHSQTTRKRYVKCVWLWRIRCSICHCAQNRQNDCHLCYYLLYLWWSFKTVHYACRWTLGKFDYVVCGTTTRRSSDLGQVYPMICLLAPPMEFLFRKFIQSFANNKKTIHEMHLVLRRIRRSICRCARNRQNDRHLCYYLLYPWWNFQTVHYARRWILVSVMM